MTGDDHAAGACKVVMTADRTNKFLARPGHLARRASVAAGGHDRWCFFKNRAGFIEVRFGLGYAADNTLISVKLAVGTASAKAKMKLSSGVLGHA